MYSEQDMREIKGRIDRYLAILLPGMAVILALIVLGYAKRVQWLAMGGMALMAVWVCFGLIFLLWPCVQYRRFLRDMQTGLSREMVGTVVSIAGEPEPQDGARVLPVHLLLTEEQDERIVYLNASKREMMPPPGAEVRLKLYGRHIRDVVPAEKGQ